MKQPSINNPSRSDGNGMPSSLPHPESRIVHPAIRTWLKPRPGSVLTACLVSALAGTAPVRADGLIGEQAMSVLSDGSFYFEPTYSFWNPDFWRNMSWPGRVAVPGDGDNLFFGVKDWMGVPASFSVRDLSLRVSYGPATPPVFGDMMFRGDSIHFYCESLSPGETHLAGAMTLTYAR